MSLYSSFSKIFTRTFGSRSRFLMTFKSFYVLLVLCVISPFPFYYLVMFAEGPYNEIGHVIKRMCVIAFNKPKNKPNNPYLSNKQTSANHELLDAFRLSLLGIL